MQIFQSKVLWQKSDKFRKWYYEKPKVGDLEKPIKNSRGNLQIRPEINTQCCFEWPAIKLKSLPVTFLIVNMFYFIQKVNTLGYNSF